MRMDKLLVGAIASLLVATPAMANPASSLSVAKAMNAKATTPSKKSSNLEGTSAILAALGAAAVIAAVVIIADDGDDAPASN